jgi:uncharacterized protein DUF3667
LTTTAPSPDTGPAVCANCGAALEGPFCSACGQSDADLRRPVLSLVTDFLDGALAWDGRFLTTMRGLYMRPGRVARDYVDGQRAKYSPPVRIYLIVTLVFFALCAGVGIRPFAINLTPDAASIRSQDPAQIDARRETLARIDTPIQTGDSAPRLYCGVMPGPDEIAADGSLVFARDTGINLTLFRRGSPPEPRSLDAANEACFQRTLDAQGMGWVQPVVVEAIRHPAAYEARAAAIASQAFLLMVAGFALLNLALHPRRPVIDHVVYSLYWNAALVPPVMLILLTLNLGGNSWPALTATGIVALAIPVFAALQERGFYGSSWLGTALRLPVLLFGSALSMTAVAMGLVWLGAR